MPANPKKPIPYRDTQAAPGSALHAALLQGDSKLAAKIYEQCEEDDARLKAKAKGTPVLVEPVMMDNERMFKGYTYVLYQDGDQGGPYRSDRTERVSEFKERIWANYSDVISKVTKCDMAGRELAVKKVNK